MIDDRTGQQFGKYRLTRLLGRGGFAEVYLGERVDIGMYAAIKIVLSQVHGDEERAFRAEAHTLAQLVHPHIVRLLDYDVAYGMPYLVMDYAPHGSLRQRHPLNTRIPLDKVVSYVQQVASALYYAHNRAIVHRDVKPENMLLDSSDEVLLSDFGIARNSTNSSTANISGTLHYMAPEQLSGKVYPQSDQYALGIVAYEWLSGSMFFSSQMQIQEIIAAILTTSPPPLRQKAPFISSAVEQVVMRALEREPMQRFATVNDFATALKQAASSTTSSIPKTPPIYQPSTPRPASGPVSSVPALPVVDTKRLIWPTFALSTTQRQEIARGQMTLVPLRTTSTIMNTPPRPLPVAQLKIPPKTDTLDNLMRSGIIARSTFAATPPHTPVMPQKMASAANVARTTGGSLTNTPKPSTPSKQVVQRTTSQSPSTSQRQTSAPTQGGRITANGFGWFCFITSAILVIVNIAQITGQTSNPYSTSQASFGYVVASVFISGVLAFIMGLVSWNSENARNNTGIRQSAAWLVVLALATIVLEIIFTGAYSHLFS